MPSFDVTYLKLSSLEHFMPSPGGYQKIAVILHVAEMHYPTNCQSPGPGYPNNSVVHYIFKSRALAHLRRLNLWQDIFGNSRPTTTL